MKPLIIIIGGLISSYVVSNLEKDNEKGLDTVIGDLVNKSEYWYDEIQKFIAETLDGIEGLDSETVKLNIDAFIGALADAVEEFLDIEEFDERVKFIEDKLAEVSENLLQRINKLEKGTVKNEN